MLFETFKLKVSVGTTSPKCIPIQTSCIVEAATFSLILNFFHFSDTITLKTVECLTPTLMTHTKIQMTEEHIQIVI